MSSRKLNKVRPNSGVLFKGFMDKFQFIEEWPSEVKTTVEARLADVQWLLPPWCQKCYVTYCDDGRSQSLQEGASIQANCDYAYRRLTLTFYPCFLGQGVEEQREQCIHDLLHATTGILADYAQEEIKRLIPNDDAPKYRAALLDELQARHEAMTQDLAYIIANCLWRYPAAPPLVVNISPRVDLEREDKSNHVDN